MTVLLVKYLTVVTLTALFYPASIGYSAPQTADIILPISAFQANSYVLGGAVGVPPSLSVGFIKAFLFFVHILLMTEQHYYTAQYGSSIRRDICFWGFVSISAQSYIYLFYQTKYCFPFSNIMKERGILGRNFMSRLEILN